MKFRRKAADSIDEPVEEIVDRGGRRRRGRARRRARPGAGPFDAEDLDDTDGRVDLGALVLLPVPGTELQLQVDEASGNVQSVMFAGPEGALELRVFAAPRHGDLWSEVRPQIAADLGRRGGTATEREGRFGTELVCQMPITRPDGKSAHAALAGDRHQRHPLAAARHPARPARGRAGGGRRRSRRR